MPTELKRPFYSIRPIHGQIWALAKSLKLDPTPAHQHAERLKYKGLPEGSEGLFAFVKSATLANQYPKALRELFIANSKWGKRGVSIDAPKGFEFFTNAQWSVTERTREMLERASAFQEGDIFLLPAQLGGYRSGITNEEFLRQVSENEFGLTSFMLTCFMLTHGEDHLSLSSYDVGCAGDRFTPYKEGQDDQTIEARFTFCPIRHNNSVDFEPLSPVNDIINSLGFASGFLQI